MAKTETLPDRMMNAVEKVRDRLLRASAALNAANVPYAIVGGNAVAAWVATIDPSAVRYGIREYGSVQLARPI